MASSLSVKDRMKLFEVGTGPTRPSPRSRMSPRQRLARLSPRGRFGRRGGATKLDQDASDDSLNSAQQGHPFNDTLSRKKAGAVQETETDKTLRETRPSGSSMPPKSPRSRQPASISQVNYDDEIMSAVTNSSNQDYEDKSRAPRSKSPRQPKSPRAFKSSKPSNVHVRFQGDPDINNNKTSNSNHEPSKPEWQIRRVRIMGSKEYESPLSKRKRNMQEAMHEHPFEKNKKAASEVVMWPDDNSDNDDEPDEYRDDLPQGFPFDNENRTPSGRSRPGAIPSIRPSGRDSPRASRRRLARSRSPSPSPTHCMGYDLNKAIEKVSRRNLLPVAVSTPAPAQYVRESPSPACTEAEVSDDEAEEETASSTINTDLEPASALCENNQTGNKLVAPIAVDTDEDGNVTLSPRKKSATLTDPSEQNLGKATNKVEADLKELEAMVKVLEEASPRKKIQVPEEKEERNGIEDTEHAIVDALSAEDDAGLNTPDEADKTEENPEAQVERTIASQSNIAAAKESYPEVSDNQKSRLATLAPTDDQESETMRKEVPSSETKSGVSVNSEGRLSRAARLRNMKAQSPAVQRFTRNKRTPSPEVNNCVMDANALKRNLESASIVMQDEKESSVGSGGSDRSCLSTEELESIASRALNMSRVLSHTKHSKLRNTPLHHLLKQRAKRGRVTAAASRASDPNIEKGKDLKKVNTTAKPIKSFDSESPDKESERQEQNVEEASGSSQIRHENINLVPATGDKHSSMKTNDSFKEPFSHFTVSNRSYKNTRLARRYLHRTYSGEETLSMASGLSAFPQHALRSSPDKTETASSVSKDGSSIPEKPTLTSDMQSSYGKTIKLPPTQGSHQGQNRHQEGFSLFQGARAGIQFCGDIGLGNISTEESFTINESSTNVTDASDSTPPPKSISVISPVQRRQIRQDMPTTSLSREHSESEKVSAGHSKTSFSTNKKVAHANALVALYKQVERQHEEPTSIKEEDSQDCHDVTKDKGPDQTESNKIEAPNDSVSQNKTDGQKATDIFTRSVARRRQHPALVKRTQARNAGRSNKKIQPDEKRMEPDEKRMEEPSRTSHKNSSSIFADKKDIALTYWKYSKAGEGLKSPMANSQEKQFVTLREENMHASHEQDAASGNALYGSNLTSDLTLSVGTGSSGEYSSKASDLPTPTREPSSSDYNSEVDESKLFGESLTSTSSAEYESELGHSPCDSRKTLNQAIATPTISKTVGFPNLCYKQDCVAISAEEGCPCDTVGTSEQGLLLFAESLRSNPDRWRSDVQHNFSTCSDRVLLNPYNGRENIGNKKDNQMLAAKPTVSDIEAKIERIRASPSQTTQSFEVNAAGNSACNVRAQAKAFPERLTEEENEGRLSSTPKQMQFKYEDLKSLSQHGKSHRTSTSYDSDDVEEYDVFKGVEHTHSCSPPPPPPPPVSREVPSGTLVGEQTALKAVSSDITGSLLFSDQSSLNIDEKECLRAVQSDVTSSLLAGEKTISLQHQVLNSSEEEGISVTLMEESEKKNDVDIMKKDTKKEVKATTEILERSESIVGSHVMMNSPEALMKLGMSFMENLYSGMCNANGTPKEKLFGMAGGVNTTGSAKGEDNEGQHDDGVPEIQSAVTSKESSDTETTNNNTLSESGTMNTDRGDENDTRRSVSVEEDEEEDPDEDSRFIPDIDDYSKDTDDLESEISLVLLEEVKAHTDNHDESDQTMTAEKLDTLEKFASLCKKEGIEILKLNRRNKWQQRYLTVSEESQCLAGLVKSLDEYPTALLWVKRFQPSQSYSLNSISNDGKGGVEFSNITSVQIETPTENSVPPKGFPKFKQSVQLNMEYSCSGGKPRSLAVRFKTQEDADFFASSVAVVQEVLESEGDKEN